MMWYIEQALQKAREVTGCNCRPTIDPLQIGTDKAVVFIEHTDQCPAEDAYLGLVKEGNNE